MCAAGLPGGGSTVLVGWEQRSRVVSQPGRRGDRGGVRALDSLLLGVVAGQVSRLPTDGIAPDSTECYLGGMTGAASISQRDLRLRSREIMDAVEGGTSFTVTRDGRPIGELIPVRARRRFVSRVDFARASAGAPEIDLEAFRRDQRAAFDDELSDPYAR